MIELNDVFIEYQVRYNRYVNFESIEAHEVDKTLDPTRELVRHLPKEDKLKKTRLSTRLHGHSG